MAWALQGQDPADVANRSRKARSLAGMPTVRSFSKRYRAGQAGLRLSDRGFFRRTVGAAGIDAQTVTPRIMCHTTVT